MCMHLFSNLSLAESSTKLYICMSDYTAMAELVERLIFAGLSMLEETLKATHCAEKKELYHI